MNIIIDPVQLTMSGRVQLDILDQNRNTKQHQEFPNAIHIDLKTEIQDAMQGNANTDFFIHTGSGWFTQNYPIGDGQDTKDGIIITQKTHATVTSTVDGRSYVDGGVENYDLLCSENKSTTYGSSNSVTWQAETTWVGEGTQGTKSTGNFDKFQIGNSYQAGDQSSMTPNAHALFDHFDIVFATAEHSSDFTQFVLDDNDIARVTWTITIGS